MSGHTTRAPLRAAGLQPQQLCGPTSAATAAAAPVAAAVWVDPAHPEIWSGDSAQKAVAVVGAHHTMQLKKGVRLDLFRTYTITTLQAGEKNLSDPYAGTACWHSTTARRFMQKHVYSVLELQTIIGLHKGQVLGFVPNQ